MDRVVPMPIVKFSKEIDVDGTIIYRFFGKKHRTDGPAEIRLSGSQFWYRHGQLHRDDGPAASWSDGTLSWYQHDKLHREDGPAVIRSDGKFEWCLKGYPYHFPVWCKKLQLTEEEIIMLRLQYG